MKLLLVRHGETVDNVAGVYAGITDSPLTNHGMVQAQKLGQFICSNHARIERIFSSDLQRAYLTAEAILTRQSTTTTPPVIRLESLREKDFGIYEGTKISKEGVGTKSDLTDHASNLGKTEMPHSTESSRSMRNRAESFIDHHLAPSLREASENSTIIVVSHGIFLGHLWRQLMSHFNNIGISASPTTEISVNRLENIKGWHNTAYLELCITRHFEDETLSSKFSVNDRTMNSASQLPQNSDHTILKNKILSHMQMSVTSINRRDHLEGLRKPRGTGSLKYELNQRTMFSYFAKRD